MSGEVSSPVIVNLHFTDKETEAQGKSPESPIRPVAEQCRSPYPLTAHPGLSHCPTLPSAHSVGAGQQSRHGGRDAAGNCTRSQTVEAQFLVLTPGEELEALPCPRMASANSQVPLTGGSTGSRAAGPADPTASSGCGSKEQTALHPMFPSVRWDHTVISRRC